MLDVLASGPLLTVQDLGRTAARRYGVPASGAMDRFALVAANRLVGNPPDAAALEITAGGAELVLSAPALVAVTGADLGARCNDRHLPLWTAVRVGRGERIRFTGRSGEWGARAYLAVTGGIAVPIALGSRATDLAGGFGGLAGRALPPGDRLPIGPPPPLAELAPGRYWPPELRPPYGSRPTLRLLPGPHVGGFGPEALELLTTRIWRVGATSNRMGYRLEGPPLAALRPFDLPSLGVVPGVIQVPPDGAPILLMADAQTTGGYPVIGTVIGADLPLAAQLLPGDALRLTLATLEEALAAHRALVAMLNQPLDADEGDLLAAMAGWW
ncbi:MAG: biotin-dependent carboxyltransferase family protein [Chloroflexaceae bacterium]|nr:biotin-dependent carboxyltransferase family protein [Chloroflexaceae bacterium]